MILSLPRPAFEVIEPQDLLDGFVELFDRPAEMSVSRQLLQTLGVEAPAQPRPKLLLCILDQ